MHPMQCSCLLNEDWRHWEHMEDRFPLIIKRCTAYRLSNVVEILCPGSFPKWSKVTTHSYGCTLGLNLSFVTTECEIDGRWSKLRFNFIGYDSRLYHERWSAAFYVTKAINGRASRWNIISFSIFFRISIT